MKATCHICLPRAAKQRISDFDVYAKQRDQFVAEGLYLLVKVGPHSVSLLRNFRILSESRSSETVPKILVLLVRAHPHCHALPVLPAACGCGATLSRHFTDHVTFSRHFLTFFYGKVCLVRLLFPFRLSH